VELAAHKVSRIGSGAMPLPFFSLSGNPPAETGRALQEREA